MTDYMYSCYEIHPTDLINGDLFWGFTKSGIIKGRNYKWNTPLDYTTRVGTTRTRART